MMLKRTKKAPDYYEQARKKVRAKKWFYRHFSTYAVITLFFFLMNATEGFNDVWWVYPAMSWGTLVLLHRLWVFGLPFTKAGTKEWEEKELARELAKMNVPFPLVAPAPSFEDEEQENLNLNMDDHLDLKEVRPKKETAPNYLRDDLV
jgi:hypothetical protein